MVGLALSVCLLVTSSSFSSAPNSGTLDKVAAAVAAPSSVVLCDEEERFVELTNMERLNQRLRPLKVDPVLVEAARKHSKDMCERNYFAHEAPTPELQSPLKRYLAQVDERPSYAMVGENLFYCSKVDVNRGQKALMESVNHRENILNGRFDRIGVGVWKGQDGSFWVTEMFLTNTPES